MAKNKPNKQIRFLQGEIKRLEAIIKRLKKQPLDKEEVQDYYEPEPSEHIIECVHCEEGFMQQIYILDRGYWKCLECERTKRI